MQVSRVRLAQMERYDQYNAVPCLYIRYILRRVPPEELLDRKHREWLSSRMSGEHLATSTRLAKFPVDTHGSRGSEVQILLTHNKSKILRSEKESKAGERLAVEIELPQTA